MKILITGGAGFIGSHIADACIQAGHTVAIVDNLSTGQSGNIEETLKSESATLFTVDITDRDGLKTVFEAFHPDVVYHLAAQINVRSSMNDPLNDATTNIIGGLNVLECMRETDCKRIIFSSTGGAMFETGTPPYDESVIPEPSSPYGIAKLTFERYLEFYSHQFGFETTILRYANVYGPRQNPLGEAGVISIFHEKIAKNEDVTIYGDGEQTRDFIHVDDVVSANLHALEKNLTGVYHVGTGIETSVNTLWSLLNIGNSNPLKPTYTPSLGEIQRSALDPEKLLATGWNIARSIQDDRKIIG